MSIWNLEQIEAEENDQDAGREEQREAAGCGGAAQDIIAQRFNPENELEQNLEMYQTLDRVMIVRVETPQDEGAIEKVTIAAFNGKPYSEGTEHLIVNALRATGRLSLSLVAEHLGMVVGHIAFSEVTIDGVHMAWYGLGPLSVLPDNQHQGIGSQLLTAGVARIRELGARGCVLEGSPAYYQRFGFRNLPGLFYGGAPSPEFFMALAFDEVSPAGIIEFDRAFTINDRQR